MTLYSALDAGLVVLDRSSRSSITQLMILRINTIHPDQAPMTLIATRRVNVRSRITFPEWLWRCLGCPFSLLSFQNTICVTTPLPIPLEATERKILSLLLATKYICELYDLSSDLFVEVEQFVWVYNWQLRSCGHQISNNRVGEWERRLKK